MDELLKQLSSYGPPGVIIAILIYAVTKVFGLYTDTQEKRLAESRETLPVIRASTDALQANTVATQACTTATNANTEIVKGLSEIVRRRE